MFRTTLILTLATYPAFAAPPPKEPEAVKLKRLWGDTTDPDKDCQFVLDGEVLKVTVPGKVNHQFTAARHSGRQGGDNAPRTGKAVAGDFTLEVKLPAAVPGADAANAGASAGAG